MDITNETTINIIFHINQFEIRVIYVKKDLYYAM